MQVVFSSIYHNHPIEELEQNYDKDILIQDSIDCLSLIKINSTKAKSKPFEYLFTNLHDFMYLMNHKFEDDSDTIKRDLSPDHIDLSKLNQAAVLDNTLIDKMILSAESFNYNKFNT